MTPSRQNIDYSVYLVTGRELLPPGKDYYDSLEESLRDGHVTIVQLREKHADTGEFLEIAQKSLKICDKYNIPMLINDNLSVALSLPDHVGLHIGQSDLPIEQARKLLGQNRLLGSSVHNVEQAKEALSAGVADYVGVGPVYGTQSKLGITTDDILGPRKAHDIVAALSDGTHRRVPCVLIGGINERNVARTLFGASSDVNYPDGVAVISAIVSQQDPSMAAQKLASVVNAYKQANFGRQPAGTPRHVELKDMVKFSSRLLQSLQPASDPPPLIQTLTSYVSATMSANVALAFNASPIMSTQEAEAEDLGRVTGAIVLNIGTIGADARRGMKAVGQASNQAGKPVVLDPVGVGASSFRKSVVDEILDHIQVTLIKGNAAELSAIAGLTNGGVSARGVDSGEGALKDPKGLVQSLAKRERCMVLLTGAVDYLSDGNTVLQIQNGHPLLGRITGSGCALGVMIAIGMAAASNYSKSQNLQVSSFSLVRAHDDVLFAGALLGILAFNIAAELAADRSDVRGPGTFIPALLDEIATIKPEEIKKRAKVTYN